MLRKTDVALIIFFVIFSLVFFLVFDFSNEGAIVKITHNENSSEADLLEEQKIEIINENDEVINIIEITDGYAKMIYSDCPDKLCVNHKEINKENETIVCLPNKVVIEIIGEDAEVDMIAQ